MRSKTTALIFFLMLGLMLAPTMLKTRASEGGADVERREQLYRLNTLGVAQMALYKYDDAAVYFKKALELDANFLTARVNLALAYFYDPQKDPKKLAAAETEANAVLKVDNKNPQMHYMLGLIYKANGKPDDAIAHLKEVLAVAPDDIYTNVYLGLLYKQKQQYAEAIPLLRHAYALEPVNVAAAYNLGTLLNQTGNREEGGKILQIFSQLQKANYSIKEGKQYFEQGHFAECIESGGNEPALVSTQVPKIKFTPEKLLPGSDKPQPLSAALARKLTKAEFDNEDMRKQLLSALGGTNNLFDIDGDGDLDLFVTTNGRGRLLRNDGGKYTDITESAKLTKVGFTLGSIAGDYDNDEKPDLFIFGYHSNLLYHNNGDGTFTEMTAASKIDADKRCTLSAAFVDYDHDGDLDLVLGNFVDFAQWPGGESATFPDSFPGDTPILYRNNGDGTFLDVTEPTGLASKHRTSAIICTDFDNHREIDLMFINYGQPAQLLSNQRVGTFKDVAADTHLDFSGKALSAAAGDFDKNGYIDFYIPQLDGKGVVCYFDGKNFRRVELSGTPGALTAQALDYDNDGLLDLVDVGAEKITLYRNLGTHFDVIAEAPRADNIVARGIGSGDIDGDGDVDLLALATDGTVNLLRNDGGNQQGWFRVQLQGRVSNRSAVGSRVVLRSGSLKDRYDVYAASPAPAASDLVFGLGDRRAVDDVSIIWPAGIVQPEIDMTANNTKTIKELDRRGTSCPLLYAWNGKQYQFVTDFLGGCAIGYLEEPGRYSIPDTDEYILVRGDQLKQQGDRYSIRMNNQLEEVIFFDAVKLLAVDHPAGTEVFPNERLMPAPPFPEFKVYTVKDPHPPVSARGTNGEDILPVISAIDRKYVEDFPLLRFKGYAREHTVTLDLGNIDTQARVLLLLTGWIDYADSTSNLAAAQAQLSLVAPYLEVKDARGEWRKVMELGYPAGLPKTMAIDISDKFLSASREVRIVTNMRIYWDQILVDTSNIKTPARITTLTPLDAELRWRGFPQEVKPDGRRPVVYRYENIEPRAPWKAHLGDYTRYGDVKPLLNNPDDMYVVTRNGDEMQIDFDARQLPPVPAGWQRDFLVYADGFGKDMDINSAYPDTVGPLPFHGMKSYPYDANESYPDDARHREYLEQYNTRGVRRQIQPRELASPETTARRQ